MPFNPRIGTKWSRARKYHVRIIYAYIILKGLKNILTFEMSINLS